MFKKLFKRRCNHNFVILSNEFKLVNGRCVFEVWCEKCNTVELVDSDEYTSIRRSILMRTA